MTFWAKFLTVVILVLAICFAAISAILFAKRDDWREANKQLQDGYNALRKDAEDKIAKLSQKVVVLDKQAREQQLRASQAEQQIEFMKGQQNALKEENTKLRGSIDALTTNYAYAQSQIKKFDERLDTLRNRRDELEKQVSQLTTKLQSTEKSNQDLQKERDDLTQALQKTREDLHAVTQEYERMTTLVADIRKVFPQVAKYIEENGVTTPTNPITGKVIAVDPENNNVIINVGRKAGVKKMFNFLIHRNKKLVGSMTIFALEKGDLAAGKIDYLTKDEQGNPMQVKVGDDVDTGLGF